MSSIHSIIWDVWYPELDDPKRLVKAMPEDQCKETDDDGFTIGCQSQAAQNKHLP